MADPTSTTLVAIGGIITALSGLVASIAALVRAMRTKPKTATEGASDGQQPT